MMFKLPLKITIPFYNNKLCFDLYLEVENTINFIFLHFRLWTLCCQIIVNTVSILAHVENY